MILLVFHDDNQNYLTVLLGQFLHKSYMLYFDRIDFSEGIDVNKTSA